jgi:glutamate racemase
MDKTIASVQPIGVFDSGVGGLSVLREIQGRFPSENLIYFADQAHVPYGSRPRSEVLRYSAEIVSYLIKMDAKLIVAACNTASAAALSDLRERFNSIPFVGMEPAVKPAAEKTHSGVVGVLATPATFQGELYAATVAKFANGVEIMQDTCPGLVGQIEQGAARSLETREILENALQPMLDAGVDEVVLGCTHYPFVLSIIREIVGDNVQVIDPAPAVARQVGRLLQDHQIQNGRNQPGETRYITSGDPQKLRIMLKDLLGVDSEVEGVSWTDERLL